MEIYKSCKACGKKCLESKFPIAGTINGKLYRRRKCQKCYQKVKLKRKRKIAAWLEAYKKTQKCNRCPVSDYRVLEFHHQAGDKEFNVADAAATGLSVEKIVVEINKCEVVCSNCHKRIHYK